jgi:hypothetical protein
MSDDGGPMDDSSDEDETKKAASSTFTPELKVLPNKGKLSVTILRAKGLAKADGFMGKADPFPKIFWEDKQVFEGKAHKSLNPKWKKDEAKCQIDFEGPAAQILLTCVGSDSRSDWTKKTGWRERPDGVGGASYFNDVTKTTSAGGKLRIELVSACISIPY